MASPSVEQVRSKTETGTGDSSTSNTFFPDWNKARTDLVFQSSDSVLFHVHKNLIRQVCVNAFNTLIPSSKMPSLEGDKGGRDYRKHIIQVPERSDILNIILHALYNLSPTSTSPVPSFDLLYDSINTMPKYDVTPNLISIPNTPIFDLLTSYLPNTPEFNTTSSAYAISPSSTPSSTVLLSSFDPKSDNTNTNSTTTITTTDTDSVAFRLYTLSATHDIFPLAQISSSYLLSFDVLQMSDSMASVIGPLYFMKLMRLHMNRIDALKRILNQPPEFHDLVPRVSIEVETEGRGRGGRVCQDIAEQKGLTKAWSFVTTYLAWDAKPNLSADMIEMACGSLTNHLTCELCIQMLEKRIKEVVDEWSSVKRTI